MKKIFKIHPLTYIIALLAVLTANFKMYLIFMLLIVIHEIGHLITGYFFHWKLKEIIVLPLGMISKYSNYLNTPLNEEIIVASMGIIVQLFFYLIFFKNNSDFYWCNLIIVIFNLIPIYPLDGSKIINIILNKIFSFKTSYLITIYLSFILNIFILIISLLKKDLIVMIIFIPLLINLLKDISNVSITINKFYLERFLYQFKFSKSRYINGLKIDKMKRDYNHYFKYKNKVYNEEKILRNLFDKP